MTVLQLALLLIAATLTAIAAWLGVTARQQLHATTWLTDAAARAVEIQREMLGPLKRMSEQGAPDALVTRLQAIETGFESQKMLVSDAVERVTALGNRVAARQRRATADVLEDDEPDVGPTPEQIRALRKLLAGDGAAPNTPAAPAPGLSLKDRAKAHRAQNGGG